MSFGFIRKQSPAARGDALRRAGLRRVDRLTKLRIEEVSSVDRGAGHGARVLITKRHERTDDMSLQEKIAKSFELRASGQLDDFSLAIMHQRRANELGKSLGEFYASNEGQTALQAALKSSYFEKQTEIAAGNGHEAFNEAMKRSPKRKKPGARTTSGYSAAADGDELDREDGSTGGQLRDSDNSGERNPMTGANLNGRAEAALVATKVAAHMAKGDSYDVAISKIYREQCGR
jgi:hypothetical protein